ncbi:4513_t:CDS:2, partial [Funneliformis geosporum]
MNEQLTKKKKLSEKDSFLSECCQEIIKEYHVSRNKDIIQSNYSCPKGYYIIKDTEYSHHGEIILRELQDDLSSLEMKIIGEVKGDQAIIYLQPESCCSLADEYKREPIKLPLIQLPANTKNIKYFDYFPKDRNKSTHLGTYFPKAKTELMD